jgi:hypothetical protein
MITPSFNLTATERVLPKLALDFTTASLDNRVTFTRTTGASNPATYVNSSGYITQATNNQPRFDYNPVTLVCKGLLIEESRANTFTVSENPTWTTASEVTVNNAATTGPDNTSSGQQIIASTNNTLHYVQQTTAFAATGNYVFSAFLKAGGYSFAQMNINFTGGNGRAVFNLANGTVYSSVNSTATIEPYANGFYRCSIVVNVTNTGAPQQTIYILSNATTATFVGDGSSGIYMYGRQLEAGAFVTSYIPTTTAALTRNADVATMTGTDFSDWFNATEGTFETQSQLYSASGTRGYLSANDGTFNNVIQLYSTGTSGNYEVVAGGVTQASQGQSSTINTGLLSRCVAYKLNNCGQAINGNFYGVDTTCTIPTVDRLQIGGINAGTSARFNGLITRLRYWPQRLSGSEIAAFSKG